MTKFLMMGLALSSVARAEPRAAVETRAAMATIAGALSEYRDRCGRFPSVEEGLDILTQAKGCSPRPILSSISRDGWDHCFTYEAGEAGYRLTSFGRDGKEGGEGPDADLILTNSPVLH